VNEKDGKVTGVNVTIDGKEKTIASNAVVLTTGGFGANMQMVTEYKPELNGFVTTNQKGSTGDGVVLAKEIGAATVDMGRPILKQGIYGSYRHLWTQPFWSFE